MKLLILFALFACALAQDRVYPEFPRTCAERSAVIRPLVKTAFNVASVSPGGSGPKCIFHKKKLTFPVLWNLVRSWTLPATQWSRSRLPFELVQLGIHQQHLHNCSLWSRLQHGRRLQSPSWSSTGFPRCWTRWPSWTPERDLLCRPRFVLQKIRLKL